MAKCVPISTSVNSTVIYAEAEALVSIPKDHFLAFVHQDCSWMQVVI